MAKARDKVRLPSSKALTLDCIVSASQEHDVPLAVLLGILSVEGGRVGEALSNTNGTWDMGPFQINTCHSNLLERKGISPGTGTHSKLGTVKPFVGTNAIHFALCGNVATLAMLCDFGCAKHTFKIIL